MKKELILTAILTLTGIILFLSLVKFKNPISIPGNIEENFFILVTGIDKGTGDNKYKLTILAEKFSGDVGKASSSQGKNSDILSAEGKTIFEAVRKFSMINSKSLFWGHIKYIIISEEVAKENVLDPLDFFIRDHEARLNTTVIISKSTSAESVLRMGDKTESFIPDLLDGVFNNIGRLSVSDEIYLLDLMKTFNNTYSSAYIPYVNIFSDKKNEVNDESKDESTSTTSASKEEYYLGLEGFATFDGEKLVGYLSDGISRGLNFINGKVKSGVIVLENSEDKNCSTEIIESSSEIKIKLNDGKPEAIINIAFSTNLGEVLTRKDIFTEEERKKMTEEQSEIIKKEAESAVEYSQKNDIDIIKINDAISHQYPSEWEKIRDNWKEVFKTMKITVNVDSKINRSYHIRQPVRSESGESE